MGLIQASYIRGHKIVIQAGNDCKISGFKQDSTDKIKHWARSKAVWGLEQIQRKIEGRVWKWVHKVGKRSLNKI